MIIIAWVKLPVDSPEPTCWLRYPLSVITWVELLSIPRNQRASLPSGHYFLGEAPCRFPGINALHTLPSGYFCLGVAPCRCPGISGVRCPVVIITWAELPVDSLKSIGRAPIDSLESIGSLHPRNHAYWEPLRDLSSTLRIR